MKDAMSPQMVHYIDCVIQRKKERKTSGGWAVPSSEQLHYVWFVASHQGWPFRVQLYCNYSSLVCDYIGPVSLAAGSIFNILFVFSILRGRGQKKETEGEK